MTHLTKSMWFMRLQSCVGIVEPIIIDASFSFVLTVWLSRIWLFAGRKVNSFKALYLLTCLFISVIWEHIYGIDKAEWATYPKGLPNLLQIFFILESLSEEWYVLSLNSGTEGGNRDSSGSSTWGKKSLSIGRMQMGATRYHCTLAGWIKQCQNTK